LTAGTAAAVEIKPGQLWALGDTIELDGSVTWAPPGSGFQPLNSYLVRHGDHTLLVDTGPKSQREILLDQLATLLPPGTNLSVFITRAELDCMGALPLVGERYQIDQILTGGSQSPLDDLTYMPRFMDAWNNRRVPLGKSVIVGLNTPGDLQSFDDFGGLDVIAPALRVLATFWAYHRPSKTLFSTDVFGHTSTASAGPRVIDDATEDPSTVESVRHHLLAKYFWLPRANQRAVLENLRRVFEDRDIEVIAPSRGLVLRGKQTVSRHYDLLREAIQTGS
jgi:flavorubredoxin